MPLDNTSRRPALLLNSVSLPSQPDARVMLTFNRPPDREEADKLGNLLAAILLEIDLRDVSEIGLVATPAEEDEPDADGPEEDGPEEDGPEEDGPDAARAPNDRPIH